MRRRSFTAVAFLAAQIGCRIDKDVFGGDVAARERPDHRACVGAECRAPCLIGLRLPARAVRLDIGRSHLIEGGIDGTREDGALVERIAALRQHLLGLEEPFAGLGEWHLRPRTEAHVAATPVKLEAPEPRGFPRRADLQHEAVAHAVPTGLLGSPLDVETRHPLRRDRHAPPSL